MRASSLALLCFTLPSTESFVVPAGTKPFIRSSKLNARNEFEYLLNENGSVDKPATRSRRIVTPGSHKKIQLASSVTAPTDAATEEAAFDTEEFELGQEGEEFSTQGENPYEQQLKIRDAKLQRLIHAEKSNPFVEWIEQADFNEIAITLFLPGLVGLGLFNWGSRKVRARFSESSELGLSNFASEVIYHDGNFDEMELCKKEWSGKLRWLGPKKNKKMLDAFLEDYAKRKPISPQAISSVSYVLSLFKMTEEKSADAFVSLCYNGGAERVSSANKLLFIGTQLFKKNPEALVKLDQIKDMIKGTYRSTAGGDEMIKVSQIAMGEAAYRNEVQKIGLTNKLPDGWQVLGLTQEKANAIYTEEKNRNFTSLKDEIYSDEVFNYNEKGQRVDDDGNVIDEEDRKRNEMEEEWEDESPSDGAFECGNCGYTIFVAEGRGSKFFGAGFKCPECGAEKDQFFSPDLDDDE